MKRIVLLLIVTVPLFSFAQSKPAPCSSLEASQFDFWLGKWDLTYNDTMHAFNEITKELGTCVIHEHFKSPATKYSGESWSVYNPKSKKWQQTWVDDQGGYIVLTGVFENNTMTLFTQPVVAPNGMSTYYRMLFHNITANAFDWKWEMTKDDGKTWVTNWALHYDRHK